MVESAGNWARLRTLSDGERTVSELAQPFTMSLAAASKHIKVLENAGLIRREVAGRVHRCSLEPMPLATADQWLAMYRRYWTEQLDTLEEILRAEDSTGRAKITHPKKKEIDDE